MAFENSITDLSKELIINHLKDKGIEYNKELDFTTNLCNKFIAWKVYSLNWKEIKNTVENTLKTLDNFILENIITKKYSLKKICFNITDCEYLEDKDTFSYLFRIKVGFGLKQTKTITEQQYQQIVLACKSAINDYDKMVQNDNYGNSEKIGASILAGRILNILEVK